MKSLNDVEAKVLENFKYKNALLSKYGKYSNLELADLQEALINNPKLRENEDIPQKDLDVIYEIEDVLQIREDRAMELEEYGYNE